MTHSPALPAELRRVMDLLRKLPGLGERTALRYAMALCGSPDDARALGHAISTLPTAIGSCAACGNIARVNELCGICTDGKRDGSTIAVVASVQHLIAFERSGAYRGRYHVLKAMVNPLEGVNGDDIRDDLNALATRLQPGMELILALPSTTEGEATTMAIARACYGCSITVTRIARGVQANGDIGDADAVTLGRAVGERQKMET